MKIKIYGLNDGLSQFNGISGKVTEYITELDNIQLVMLDDFYYACEQCNGGMGTKISIDKRQYDHLTKLLMIEPTEDIEERDVKSSAENNVEGLEVE